TRASARTATVSGTWEPPKGCIRASMRGLLNTTGYSKGRGARQLDNRAANGTPKPQAQAIIGRKAHNASFHPAGSLGAPKDYVSRLHWPHKPCQIGIILPSLYTIEGPEWF